MMNALLPALLLAAGNGPASAELSFEHSELTTPAGAAAVYQRVVDVAEQVCAEENRHSAMAASSARLCVTDTVARTLDQIAAPQLNQIHAARSITPDGRTRTVLAAARD